MTDKKDASRAPAALRTTAILHLLAAARQPLTLSQVAAGLDILPSSCLNILRDLVQSGLVQRTEATKQYAIGLDALLLAYRHLAQNSLARSAQIHLDDLKAKYNATALVAQRNISDRLVCVAVSQGAHGGALQAPVGLSENVYGSAVGRLILARENCDETELAHIFSQLAWASPPDAASWVDDIRAARERGYAVDVGHYRLGLAFATVLLLSDEDALVGTLSVAMPIDQWQKTDQAALISDMRSAASRMARSAIA